jgi:hypothetical protein
MTNKTLFSLFLISILSACGGPVNIEGDVFIVKGDGKPQPAAAKEVIFLSLNKETGLEELLTNIYLDSISEEVEKNEALINDLCEKSAVIIQNSLDYKKDSLSKIINSAKSAGITDPDGSCSIINSNAIESTAAAVEKEAEYDELILLEQNKINEANAKITALKQSMQSKINQHETELYENFSKNIIFNISRSRKGGNNNGRFTITNNTPYNIKLSRDIIITVYNSAGISIGTHYDSSLFECSYSPSNMTNGLLLKTTQVNLSNGSDDFGFVKTRYLPKGATSGNFGYNSFCSRSFSSSERLKNTKAYGDNTRDWPDPMEPDLTKGYKILSGGKFIPLEDEIRTEKNDEVVYSSKPINFKKIASEKSWPEKPQIQSQENIIKNAKVKLAKLQMDKSNEKLIAKSISDKMTKKNCTNHINNISIKEGEIFETNELVNTFKACDIGNADLVPSLVLEDTNDIKLKEKVLNVNFSKKASSEALNMIANAEHKVSTNISGHYQIKELPRGDYLIMSSYSDNFIEGIFLVNTSIKEDGVLDLSNSNYFSIPSFSYLIRKFYENCSNKTCTRDDLSNTLDIQEIAEYYETYKEEIEEATSELKRLCRQYGISC